MGRHNSCKNMGEKPNFWFWRERKRCSQLVQKLNQNKRRIKFFSYWIHHFIWLYYWTVV